MTRIQMSMPNDYSGIINSFTVNLSLSLILSIYASANKHTTQILNSQLIWKREKNIVKNTQTRMKTCLFAI